MYDLFRFFQLRPADVAAPRDVKVLSASFAVAGSSRTVARRAAQQFVEENQRAADGLARTYALTASAVRDAVAKGPIAAGDIAKLVQEVSGSKPAQVVDDPKFHAEESSLADLLVAMWLMSDSSGADAPGLAKLAQGYDIIRLVASGRDPVSMRVLSIKDFAADLKPPQTDPDAPKTEKPSAPPDFRQKVRDLEKAIATLNTLPASGFSASAGNDQGSGVDRMDTHLNSGATNVAPMEQLRDRSGKASEAVATRNALMSTASSVAAQPWVLSAEAVSVLGDDVKRTLMEAGLDPMVQPLPVVLTDLHAARTEALAMAEQADIPQSTMMNRVGGSFTASLPVNHLSMPNPPNLSAVPVGHGDIRPVGVGDLLLVKQHVIRYEGGDLAHVENVLKSETLSRETRRLERTETTVLQETETTKEETRDTQTTDRFSMKRETSDTIKTDSSLKAGLSVDAKYGPFVEVKANADFATSTSEESSTKQATEFSKDVVDRSASKLVERVLERRSTTTITEFEEKYSHGFNNAGPGAANITGMYQWIDKVMQAQVYNYGKRLLFDVTVPEPGANFIIAQSKSAMPGQNLTKPAPFTLTASQINEGNYTTYAAMYEVTGLEPPPPPIKTFSKAYDATVSQDPHESSKSDAISIDAGYRAKYALFQCSWMGWAMDGLHWKVIIGNRSIDARSSVGYFDLAGEVASVPVAYEAYRIELLAATIEIFCVRMAETMTAWQFKMHAAIAQGYAAKLQAYETALAEATAAAGTVIAGKNPLFNAQLISNELRKQCLMLLTGDHFDSMGAWELSSQGVAQPNFSLAADQMPYVRFFEQAFEWEHIVYFFYPYFWGYKAGWNTRMLLDDVDPPFADFLRAGAARVVFPVRPGFEAAVIHYLDTGEIWSGGPPPDISSSLYVPIVKEIQGASGAPGNEVPVGDPWLVYLPTTLVQLRPNNDLPTWQKTNEVWTPTN